MTVLGSEQVTGCQAQLDVLNPNRTSADATKTMELLEQQTVADLDAVHVDRGSHPCSLTGSWTVDTLGYADCDFHAR